MKRIFYTLLFFLWSWILISNSEGKKSIPYYSDVVIEIHPRQTIHPVNRLILGNNIQWTNGGDGVLVPESLNFRPEILTKIITLHSTVLRYPGGCLADLYHWREGVGPAKNRGYGEFCHGGEFEKIYFGTLEFLKLARLTGALPLVTVNTITGTPEEAVQWMKFINSLSGLPRVEFWEVGNEPYLKSTRDELNVLPEEFAARANIFLRFMREADPESKLGLPVSNGFFERVVPAPYNKFNDRVLPLINQPFDFVAVHNAYQPAFYSGIKDTMLAFRETMAATRRVKEDLDLLRKSLEEYFPEKIPPFAITEYNAFYTLLKGESDKLIRSPAAAFYVADLIMMLARRNDVLMANFWSLVGNWYFGAIDQQTGNVYPSYCVLKGFSEILKGDVLKVKLKSPSFTAPAYEKLPRVSNIPLISALALKDGKTFRIIILNRDLWAAHVVRVRFHKYFTSSRMERWELYCTDCMNPEVNGENFQWAKSQISHSQPFDELRLFVKPHSLLVIILK